VKLVQRIKLLGAKKPLILEIDPPQTSLGIPIDYSWEFNCV